MDEMLTLLTKYTYVPRGSPLDLTKSHVIVAKRLQVLNTVV
jgi:hypothetical protein